MNKILLNNVLKAAWTFCAWLCATCALAQERMYADGDCEFTPGGDAETQYISINMENAALEYVAYQVDVVLPDGLELVYDEGAPDIFIDKTKFYVKKGTPNHQLSVRVNDKTIRVICASLNNDKFYSRSGELFVIGVTASPYLKPGDVKVELRNITFSDIDLNGPTYDAFEATTVGTASSTSTLTLKVSASNKYSTAILPFDDELPAGLEAYSCEDTDDDCLVLTKQSSIKAFTPYIVFAPNGYEGTLTGTVDAEKYQATVTNGYLTGTVVKTEVTGGNGNYVLQNQGEGPMFYRVGDTSFAIPAGKCWLTLPASLQGVSALKLQRPTGIERIPLLHSDAPTYDLSGRQVANPNKGVYIVGGKKVVK